MSNFSDLTMTERTERGPGADQARTGRRRPYEPRPTVNSIWIPERVAELDELHQQGLSCSAIARKMGLTKSQVVGRLSRMGVLGGLANRAERWAYYHPGEALPILRKGRKAWIWTASRDEALFRLHRKGLSFRKIAVILGVGETAPRRRYNFLVATKYRIPGRTYSLFDDAPATLRGSAWMRRNASWRRVDTMGV